MFSEQVAIEPVFLFRSKEDSDTQITGKPINFIEQVLRQVSEMVSGTADVILRLVESFQIASLNESLPHDLVLSSDLFIEIFFHQNTVMKVENLLKLEEIANLENDWNNNNAKKFDKQLIKKCKDIIEHLPLQPDIFPTARQSIQFEFYDYKNSEKYLEFEIFTDRNKMLKTITDRENIIIENDVSINRMVQEIYSFYA